MTAATRQTDAELDALAQRMRQSHCDTCDTLVSGSDYECTCGHIATADALLALRSERDALLMFAGIILGEHREDLCNVDGGTIQDAAVKAGLLTAVEFAEPCSDNCRCAEYDDWPVICYRTSDLGKACLAAPPKENE